jgi:hypothetical protein
MNRFARIIAIAVPLLAVLGARPALAGPPPRDAADRAPPAGDYLFPAPLRAAASAATGSPYVAIGELALGFGPHAAVGLVAGLTPRVAGFGVHPRFALGVAPGLRAIARVPLLYYPETNDAESWALTRPSLVLETAAWHGWHVYAGGGALWAACLDEVFGGGAEGHAHGLHEPVPNAEQPMNVLFWTANAGAALSLTAEWHAFVDLASVMEGPAFAGSRWTDFGGPPLIAVLGATAQF